MKGLQMDNHEYDINDLAQDCDNSSALAMELSQPWVKSLIRGHYQSIASIIPTAMVSCNHYPYIKHVFVTIHW